jgi:predicted dinucleotide-binding enzyme
VKFGVLGTGTVGQALASKLRELGHDVRIGSRQAGEDKVTFADAASFGDVVMNATSGAASLDALAAAGPAAHEGKVLIDVANPLVFGGGAPTLSVCNDDSLGEQVQRAYPGTRVVKALHTVNAGVMVAPGDLPERHNIFICGNDDAAKRQVAELLDSFGWPADDIADLGDITAARGMEMYLALWLRLMGATGTPQFNIRVVRGAG